MTLTVLSLLVIPWLLDVDVKMQLIKAPRDNESARYNYDSRSQTYTNVSHYLVYMTRAYTYIYIYLCVYI